MYKSDIKIFELITLLKTLSIISYDKDFCESIGVLKQNLAPIKQGKAHFTAKHIENVCKVYNVNANWIFDTEKNVFKTSSSPVKSSL